MRLRSCGAARVAHVGAVVTRGGATVCGCIVVVHVTAGIPLCTVCCRRGGRVVMVVVLCSLAKECRNLFPDARFFLRRRNLRRVGGVSGRRWRLAAVSGYVSLMVVAVVWVRDAAQKAPALLLVLFPLQFLVLQCVAIVTRVVKVTVHFVQQNLLYFFFFLNGERNWRREGIGFFFFFLPKNQKKSCGRR